jgi:hypothetical protein
MRKVVLALIACVVVTGCSSLSSAGKGVSFAGSADDVKGCRSLGDVSANPPFVLPGDWKVKLQNKTGELGGNRVVADSPGIGAVHGVAYSCPAP